VAGAGTRSRSKYAMKGKDEMNDKKRVYKVDPVILLFGKFVLEGK
jgi:hypothetical protein